MWERAPSTPRLVSLKRIYPPFSRDEALRELFFSRMAIVSRLRGPVLQPVLDHGEVSGILYVASELPTGLPLSTLLQQLRLSRSPMPPGLAVSLILQLCEGVQSLHREALGEGSLVHGNLKPSNITVDGAGVAHILDAGCSVALAAGGGPLWFVSRDALSYMAPEVLSGEPLEPQADVFSLAALLVELLTLTPVLEVTRALPALQQLLRLDLRPLSQRMLQAGFDRELVELIEWALDPEVGKRLEDAGSFADALADLGPREAMSSSPAEFWGEVVQALSGGVATDAPLSEEVGWDLLAADLFGVGAPVEPPAAEPLPVAAVWRSHTSGAGVVAWQERESAAPAQVGIVGEAPEAGAELGRILRPRAPVAPAPVPPPTPTPAPAPAAETLILRKEDLPRLGIENLAAPPPPAPPAASPSLVAADLMADLGEEEDEDEDDSDEGEDSEEEAAAEAPAPTRATPNRGGWGEGPLVLMGEEVEDEGEGEEEESFAEDDAEDDAAEGGAPDDAQAAHAEGGADEHPTEWDPTDDAFFKEGDPMLRDTLVLSKEMIARITGKTPAPRTSLFTPQAPVAVATPNLDETEDYDEDDVGPPEIAGLEDAPGVTDGLRVDLSNISLTVLGAEPAPEVLEVEAAGGEEDGGMDDEISAADELAGAFDIEGEEGAISGGLLGAGGGFDISAVAALDEADTYDVEAGADEEFDAPAEASEHEGEEDEGPSAERVAPDHLPSEDEVQEGEAQEADGADVGSLSEDESTEDAGFETEEEGSFEAEEEGSFEEGDEASFDGAEGGIVTDGVEDGSADRDSSAVPALSATGEDTADDTGELDRAPAAYPELPTEVLRVSRPSAPVRAALAAQGEDVPPEEDFLMAPAVELADDAQLPAEDEVPAGVVDEDVVAAFAALDESASEDATDVMFFPADGKEPSAPAPEPVISLTASPAPAAVEAPAPAPTVPPPARAQASTVQSLTGFETLEGEVAPLEDVDDLVAAFDGAISHRWTEPMGVRMGKKEKAVAEEVDPLRDPVRLKKILGEGNRRRASGPLPEGTLIEGQIKIVRRVELGPSRSLYEAVPAPEALTRRCWECGYGHNTRDDRRCFRCHEPLTQRHFLLSVRWDKRLVERELLLASKPLHHPQISRLYGWLAHEGALCRLLDLRTDRFSYKGRTLPAEKAISIALDLCSALSYLSEIGVAVTDIMPAHVALGDEGAQLYDPDVAEVTEGPSLPGLQIRAAGAIARLLSPHLPVEAKTLAQVFALATDGKMASPAELATSLRALQDPNA